MKQTNERLCALAQKGDAAALDSLIDNNKSFIGKVVIGVHSKNYTDDGFNVGQYHHIAPVNEDTVGEYTGLKEIGRASCRERV